jgi:hypothetical protein
MHLVHSGFTVESLLLHSQVLTEYFVLANSRKVSTDYKKHDLYIANKTRYNLALNTILLAVQQIYMEMREHQRDKTRSA